MNSLDRIKGVLAQQEEAILDGLVWKAFKDADILTHCVAVPDTPEAAVVLNSIFNRYPYSFAMLLQLVAENEQAAVAFARIFLRYTERWLLEFAETFPTASAEFVSLAENVLERACKHLPLAMRCVACHVYPGLLEKLHPEVVKPLPQLPKLGYSLEKHGLVAGRYSKEMFNKDVEFSSL